MASENTIRILLKKEAPLTERQRSMMSESQAFAWISAYDRKEREAKSNMSQI